MEAICVSYIEFSRILATVASMVITVGLYSQATKIWRTKSARDFSALLVAALLLDEIAWLNYGLAIYEWPIILIAALNIPAVILAVVGYLKYRKCSND